MRLMKAATGGRFIRAVVAMAVVLAQCVAQGVVARLDITDLHGPQASCCRWRVVDFVLPDKASAITCGVGQPQIDLMKDLETRLAGETATWEGAQELLAEVTAYREAYEVALAARTAAVDTVRAKRIQRDVVREKFLDMYAKCCADI